MKLQFFLQREWSDLLKISDDVEDCVLVSTTRSIIPEAVAKGLTEASLMLKTPVEPLPSKPKKKEKKKDIMFNKKVILMLKLYSMN